MIKSELMEKMTQNLGKNPKNNTLIDGSPYDYYTVAEFCKKFPISKQSVQRRILAGKISAIKFGQKYLIHKNEVDRIAKNGLI